MDLIRKVEIPHTELYWLYRTRSVRHTDVNVKQSHQFIPEDYNYSAETCGYVNVSVTPTKELTQFLLDTFHPYEEGHGLNVPTTSALFDAYFRDREKVIEHPKVFIADYKERSTINLKRSDKTRVEEAQRVNKLIEDNLDELNYKLGAAAKELFTSAIDKEIQRHNKSVMDTVKRYVMDDGVDEDWIVENLYTKEQQGVYKAQMDDMTELRERVDELREQHRKIKQAKNTQRRHIMQQQLLNWTDKIPELQVYIEELPIGEAIDRDINMVLM